MRKIIRGVRYDTEKARLVGQASCCCWDAWLFCARRSGRYFLFGEGGPMSRFAQSAGRNVLKGGRDIIPLSREEALRWAREYLEPNEIGAEFGESAD